MAKLGTPKLTLVLADPEFPDGDEGRPYVVQTRNIDLCAFDRHRGQLGWPDAKEAPFLWMTYIGWKALQRTGQIDPCSLADFETRCLSIESSEDTPADPTPPVAASD